MKLIGIPVLKVRLHEPFKLVDRRMRRHGGRGTTSNPLPTRGHTAQRFPGPFRTSSGSYTTLSPLLQRYASLFPEGEQLSRVESVLTERTRDTPYRIRSLPIDPAPSRAFPRLPAPLAPFRAHSVPGSVSGSLPEPLTSSTARSPDLPRTCRLLGPSHHRQALNLSGTCHVAAACTTRATPACSRTVPRHNKLLSRTARLS